MTTKPLTPAERARPPRPGTVRTTSFPPFSRTRLANGPEVLFAHWPRLPLLSLEVMVPGGGQYEDRGRPGLASLHGELLDEGTRRHTALEIAETVERLGIYLGTGADWHTTHVAANLMTVHLEASLELMAELLFEPSFPPEEIERICRRRRAEILRRRGQPRSLADYGFHRTVYAGTVFADPLIGTEASVAALGRDDVLDFYERHVGPRGAVIVAVGASDEEALLERLEEVFGGWCGPPSVEAPRIEPPPPAPTGVCLVDRPGAAQTELLLGHLGLPRHHPDQPVTLLLNTLLGGKFTSRINLNLRERHGLTYGAHSQFVYRRAAGHFLVRAAVATESAGLAVREVLSEMRRLQDEPAGGDELRETQDYLVGLFPSTLQTVGDVAKRLETLALYDLPDDYYDHYPANVRELDGADVQRAAQRHLHPERLVIVAVGPADVLRPQLAPFGPVRVVQPADVLGSIPHLRASKT